MTFFNLKPASQKMSHDGFNIFMTKIDGSLFHKNSVSSLYFLTKFDRIVVKCGLKNSSTKVVKELFNLTKINEKAN